MGAQDIPNDLGATPLTPFEQTELATAEEKRKKQIRAVRDLAAVTEVYDKSCASLEERKKDVTTGAEAMFDAAERLKNTDLITEENPQVHVWLDDSCNNLVRVQLGPKGTPVLTRIDPM
jgi:hypothetical protein